MWFYPFIVYSSADLSLYFSPKPTFGVLFGMTYLGLRLFYLVINRNREDELTYERIASTFHRNFTPLTTMFTKVNLQSNGFAQDRSLFQIYFHLIRKFRMRNGLYIVIVIVVVMM